MNAEQILTEVNEIFQDVLEDDSLAITFQTNASQVEAWDSLNHIQLVVAIEKHFRLRFTAAEIQKWKNVGEMCLAIEARLKQA